MEATHDEVFRQLEQPRQQHLLDDVRGLGHHAHVVDVDAPSPPPSEKSPLVVKAGTQRVYIDSDVDLVLLDKQFRREEHETVEADREEPLANLWKQEAASLALLAIPITLAVMLEIFPLILMSMLIGQVSGDASPQVLAGSSLSDFFQGQVTIAFAMGLGSAVATMCSQSFGARQYRQLWIYAQAGVVAGLYCLLPLGVLCLNSARLLTMLGQNPALAHIAENLITIAFVSVPFSLTYTIARSALQAQNIAVPFVFASLVSYAVSFPLGYYLGNHTSLGYIGIYLSMIISQVLRALAVVPILLRNKIFNDSWPGWQWKEAHSLARRLWPITTGSVMMATFQTAGFNAIVLLCGLLPNTDVVMAANNISSGLVSLAFIPMMGLGAGGTVRVGNALGAGQPRRASVAALVVIAETLAISFVGLVLCRLAAKSYAQDFTSHETTIELSTRLSQFLTALIPCVAFVLSTQAIFQACGAQWLCAKLNFLILVVLGIPLGIVCAIPLGAGVFGLWIGNMSGAVVFTIAAIAWFVRLDWKKTAHEARENAHLHVEQEVETESSSATTD